MILDTIIDLQDRGFTCHFALLGDELFCAQTNCFFNGYQFDVLEIYSFENERSYKDETLIYAIECYENTIKGILFENIGAAQNVLSVKLRKFWK